eukprot:Clim_evm3s66 gene=Clim_evmTU3s66
MENSGSPAEQRPFQERYAKHMNAFRDHYDAASRKGKKCLVLASPVRGERPEIYKWPLLMEDEYDPASDLLDTIRLVLGEFGDQEGVVSMTYGVDRKSYSSMRKLCDHFNAYIMHALSKTESKGLLQREVTRLWASHICRQTYNRSIDDPMKLNEYSAFTEEVYGEFSYEMFDHVIQTVGIGPEDIFLDLGSGVGQIVVQVATQCKAKLSYGIEKNDVPAGYAKLMSKNFDRLMAFYGKEHGKYVIEQGDFLEDRVIEYIKKATVIFCNNFAFGPKVNHHLSQRLLDAQDGAVIISSLTFAPLHFRISERTIGDIGAILDIRKVHYDGAGGVSWTDKPFDYFISTVNRGKVEKWFNDRINQINNGEAVSDSDEEGRRRARHRARHRRIMAESDEDTDDDDDTESSYSSEDDDSDEDDEDLKEYQAGVYTHKKNRKRQKAEKKAKASKMHNRHKIRRKDSQTSQTKLSQLSKEELAIKRRERKEKDLQKILAIKMRGVDENLHHFILRPPKDAIDSINKMHASHRQRLESFMRTRFEGDLAKRIADANRKRLEGARDKNKTLRRHLKDIVNEVMELNKDSQNLAIERMKLLDIPADDEMAQMRSLVKIMEENASLNTKISNLRSQTAMLNRDNANVKSEAAKVLARNKPHIEASEDLQEAIQFITTFFRIPPGAAMQIIETGRDEKEVVSNLRSLMKSADYGIGSGGSLRASLPPGQGPPSSADGGRRSSQGGHSQQLPPMGGPPPKATGPPPPVGPPPSQPPLPINVAAGGPGPNDRRGPPPPGVGDDHRGPRGAPPQAYGGALPERRDSQRGPPPPRGDPRGDLRAAGGYDPRDPRGRMPPPSGRSPINEGRDLRADSRGDPRDPRGGAPPMHRDNRDGRGGGYGGPPVHHLRAPYEVGPPPQGMDGGAQGGPPGGYWDDRRGREPPRDYGRGPPPQGYRGAPPQDRRY